MRIFFILIIVGLLMCCHDIFEKDISGKTVNLIAPGDSVEINYKHREQTFAWEEKNGASAYHFVLVTPSFDKVESYLQDTLVEGLNYTVILEPGEYSWRVRPENPEYKGNYTTRYFKILEEEIIED